MSTEDRLKSISESTQTHSSLYTSVEFLRAEINHKSIVSFYEHIEDTYFQCTISTDDNEIGQSLHFKQRDNDSVLSDYRSYNFFVSIKPIQHNGSTFGVIVIDSPVEFDPTLQKTIERYAEAMSESLYVIGQQQAITQSIQTINRRRASEIQSVSNALRVCMDGMVRIDMNGVVFACNNKAETLFGYTFNQLKNLHISKILTGFDVDQLGNLEKEQIHVGCKRNDGYGFVSIMTSIEDSSLAGKRSFTLLFKDVSDELKRKNQNRDLQDRVNKDDLTGLFNRAHGLSWAEQYLTSEITSRNRLYAGMIDIDHFKSVNDQYGHAMGDAVLIQFSKLLISHVREGDLVCRYGGEEFLLFITAPDDVDAHNGFERIRLAVERTVFRHDSNSIKITCSAGYKRVVNASTLVSDIRRADSALYTAKGISRNRVVSSDDPQCDLFLDRK